MFIGHYAFGLAGKRLAPRTSLGTLVAAASLPDLLWPVLLLFGVEQVEIAPGDTAFTPLRFVSYPYSHSLLMVVTWASLFGLGYFAATRYLCGAIAIAGLVLSHWILDAVSHRPDLPLYPGSVVVIGAGLWNSIPATVVIELTLFIAGLGLYLGITRPIAGKVRLGLWSLITLLLLSYAANLIAPPPPSTTAIAATGSIGSFLLVLWAAWADSGRRSAP